MTTDVVCVLDGTLTQVFEDARPLKVTVRRESKPMEHPIESGAVITDHRVILPVEIELSLTLPPATYTASYQKISDLFGKGELLTVQTKTDSYANMVIQAMPHEETADMFDAVPMALTFKEVVYVNAQFSDLKVSKTENAKTVKRGEQQPQQSAKQSSILSRLFK